MNKLLSAVTVVAFLLAASASFAGDLGPRASDLESALPSAVEQPAADNSAETKSAPSGPSPYLAGALSLVIPGAGQMYNDDYTGGTLLMIGSIGCYIGAMAYSGMIYQGEKPEFRLESGIMLAAGGALHLFSIFDAVTEANRLEKNLARLSVAPSDDGVTVGYGFAW